MTEFTPVASLLGGALIGLSAVLLMAWNGRVAGISGILDGATAPEPGGAWRYWFLGGLLAGPLAFAAVRGGLPVITLTHSWPLLVVAGLLVGAGTRLSGGCTSGHGICGMALLSTRSLVAVGVFMAVALATVSIARHVVAS